MTSTLREARTVIASQPAILVVMLAMGCAGLLLAVGFLAVGQEVQVQLGLAIGRTQISVFLAPQLARADAEALRSRIEALPTVSGATLRTRDDALAALVSDGLPPFREQANPLPDVWIVKLRWPAPEAREKSPSAYVASARESFSALPGVESVEVDSRWIALVDRWTSWADRFVPPFISFVFVGLAAFLTCVSFLAARAYRANRDKEPAFPTVRALATIGILAGTLSLLVTVAAVWGVANFLPTFDYELKPIVDQVGHTLASLSAALASVGIVAPLAGMLAGSIGR